MHINSHMKAAEVMPFIVDRTTKDSSHSQYEMSIRGAGGTSLLA